MGIGTVFVSESRAGLSADLPISAGLKTNLPNESTHPTGSQGASFPSECLDQTHLRIISESIRQF